MAANLASDLIARTRAQFAGDAHGSLQAAHGHHFAHLARPPPAQRQPAQQRQPPPKRPPAEMMEAHAPEPDPVVVRAQKQQKIAAHNARINAHIGNNSKAKVAPEDQTTQ